MKNINICNIAKKITLYEYKNTYYLTFDNINTDIPLTSKFNSLITEFGNYVDNSDLFIRKLTEAGNVVIKNSSISNYIKVI